MKPHSVLVLGLLLVAGALLYASNMHVSRHDRPAVPCDSGSLAADSTAAPIELDVPLPGELDTTRAPALPVEVAETGLEAIPLHPPTRGRTEQLQQLDRLSERFLESYSWCRGYELVSESLIVSLEHPGPTSRAPAPLESSAQYTGDVRRTYVEGRTYTWSAADFPVMAAMLDEYAAWGQAGQRRDLSLNAVRRLEINAFFERARSELVRAR